MRSFFLIGGSGFISSLSALTMADIISSSFFFLALVLTQTSFFSPVSGSTKVIKDVLEKHKDLFEK